MKTLHLLLPFLLTATLFAWSAPRNDKAHSDTILFLGDSLTAGHGLSADQAYPALIQGKIDRQGWNYSVLNAGLSGDTSAGGLRRIDWLLQRKIDVLVLELGANDGLRGVTTEVTMQNLQAIIDKTKQKYPQVKFVVAGMMMPPSMGQEYTHRFRSIFPKLAEKNAAALIPFLLQGVAGQRELNLPDGIHPTAEGHRIIAENVWKVLKPLLDQE
ncbi:MAG: arylesterase [Acidobacteriota bacterium]